MSKLCTDCCVYFCDFMDIIKSREKLLNFLFAHKCLVEKTRCLQCRKVTLLNFSTLLYVCHMNKGYLLPKKRQRKRMLSTFTLSGKRGSFFECGYLPIEKICEFVLYWLLIPHSQQSFWMEQLDITSRTAIKLSSRCREVCVNWVRTSNPLLGGDGVIVEVDITKIWKRKCSSENDATRGIWVVGGYERKSGNVFLVQVEKLDEATLLTVIKEHVRPNTTIISDLQHPLNSLEDEGYIHMTFDIKKCFKEPKTGAHTNHILRLWRDVKSGVPKFGYKLRDCEGYLCEFLFKRRFADSRQRLHAFWTSAGKLHVPIAAQKPYAIS